MAPETNPCRLRHAIQLWCVLLGLLYTAGFTAATTFANKELRVDAFERIHLKGNAQVHLEQRRGAAAEDTPVKVSGAPQGMRDLVIESSDGVLYIDAATEPDGNVVIHLTVGDLKELVSDGPALVEGDHLSADMLTLETRGLSRIDIQHLHVTDLTVIGTGESSISLSGEVENQYVDLQGPGRYLAQGLASQTSQVSVRGASQVELWVEQMLDVNMSGDGRLSYSGRPWVQQHMHGKGAISRLSD